MKPRPRQRRGPSSLLLAGLVMLCAACATPRESRQRLAEIDETWHTTLPEGSEEELLEQIELLGNEPADEVRSLASVPPLLRLALDSPAALVRTQALGAAWKLGAALPTAPLRTDDLPADAFTLKAKRFELLAADPSQGEPGEVLQLARFLGAFRFPPGRAGLAVELADTVTSRALWSPEGELQRVFAEALPGCLQHALTVVTLTVADDPFAFARTEALHDARWLEPDVALTLLTGSFQVETDSQVLLAGLETLAVLAPRLPADEVEQLLAHFDDRQDVALRQKAEAVRSALSP